MCVFCLWHLRFLSSQTDIFVVKSRRRLEVRTFHHGRQLVEGREWRWWYFWLQAWARWERNMGGAALWGSEARGRHRWRWSWWGERWPRDSWVWGPGRRECQHWGRCGTALSSSQCTDDLSRQRSWSIETWRIQSYSSGAWRIWWV